MLDFLWVFLVGGGICAVGQLLLDKTKLTPARILVLFVTGGVVLTALGLYEPVVRFAGAGATVPIVGFGYALAKGAQQAAAAGGFLGALGGGLKATAVGIGAAVFFGWLFAMIAKPGDKG